MRTSPYDTPPTLAAQQWFKWFVCVVSSQLLVWMLDEKKIECDKMIKFPIHHKFVVLHSTCHSHSRNMNFFVLVTYKSDRACKFFPVFNWKCCWWWKRGKNSIFLLVFPNPHLSSPPPHNWWIEMLSKFLISDGYTARTRTTHVPYRECMRIEREVRMQ